MMLKGLLPLLLLGCAAGARTQAPAPATLPAARTAESWDRPQYPSTYHRHPNPPVLIRNATILTATGPELSGASILLKEGRIVAVGSDVTPPADATVVDGTGQVRDPRHHRHP